MDGIDKKMEGGGGGGGGAVRRGEESVELTHSAARCHDFPGNPDVLFIWMLVFFSQQPSALQSLPLPLPPSFPRSSPFTLKSPASSRPLGETAFQGVPGFMAKRKEEKKEEKTSQRISSSGKGG